MLENITVKLVFRRGEGDEKVMGGDEFDQSLLYACMEISQ
jgi:hypothetical protein